MCFHLLLWLWTCQLLLILLNWLYIVWGLLSGAFKFGIPISSWWTDPLSWWRLSTLILKPAISEVSVITPASFSLWLTECYNHSYFKVHVLCPHYPTHLSASVLFIDFSRLFCNLVLSPGMFLPGNLLLLSSRCCERWFEALSDAILLERCYTLASGKQEEQGVYTNLSSDGFEMKLHFCFVGSPSPPPISPDGG